MSRVLVTSSTLQRVRTFPVTVVARPNGSFNFDELDTTKASRRGRRVSPLRAVRGERERDSGWTERNGSSFARITQGTSVLALGEMVNTVVPAREASVALSTPLDGELMTVTCPPFGNVDFMALVTSVTEFVDTA